MTKRLLWLNGLAVIGVILNHASTYGFQALVYWSHRFLPADALADYDPFKSLAFYGLVLIQQLIFFTLPAFAFVSGSYIAFLGGGTHTNIKWTMVEARIRNLIIPFVIWTTCYYLLIIRKFPTDLNDLFEPYYYIPLLVQLFLVSPVIVWLARRHWKSMLVVFGFCEVSLHVLRNLHALGVHLYGLEKVLDYWPQWLLPNLLFWFSFGIVFGFHRQVILPWLERNKWFLLVGMIAMVPLTLVEYELVRQLLDKEWLGIHFRSLTTFLFALFFLLAFLAFHQFAFPFPKLLSSLGSRSLGIYLAHYLALFLAGALMYRYLPWMLGRQLIYLSILIAAGLGIPILLIQFASRPPLRRVYRYIFG